MKYRYSKDPALGKQKGSPGGGRRVDPSKWITGSDPLTHDKYYAYLKHKAQARYRNEYHDLTWEQWESFWSHSDFLKRGRSGDSLCLAMIDQTQGWTYANCEVIRRKEQLQRRPSRKSKNE